MIGQSCGHESMCAGKPSSRAAVEIPWTSSYHHRKFFRATWSWKMTQKLIKTQKFRESQFAPKNKIWSFARFLKLSFTSTVHNVTIWCALESLGLGQPFKHLERYHIMRKKVFRGTWGWKMLEKLTKTQKLRKSQLALKNKIWDIFQLQVGLKTFLRVIW